MSIERASDHSVNYLHAQLDTEGIPSNASKLLMFDGIDDKRLRVPVLMIKEGELAKAKDPKNVSNSAVIEGKSYVRAHTTDGQDVWVDVDAFAKAFHFSPDKVQQVGERGGLESLVDKRKDFGKILDQYEAVLTNYKENKNLEGPLQSLSGEATPPYLTKKLLLKMIKVGLRELNQSGASSAAFEVKGQQVFGSRDIKGNLQMIIRSPSDQLLGKGSFGEAHRVYDVVAGDKAAFKTILPKLVNTPEAARARNEIINEAVKLPLVHANGEVEGVVLPPRGVINISGGKPEVGFWTREYPGGDAFDFTAAPVGQPSLLPHGGIESRSPWEMIGMGLKLLEGLARLEEIGLIHGDIKPENMFVSEDNDGHLLIRLADFGGAETVDEAWDRMRTLAKEDPTQFTKKGLGTITPPYLAQEEAENILEIVQDAVNLPVDAPPQRLKELKAKFQVAQQARDRLALGISLFTIMIGIPPVPQGPFADVKLGINKEVQGQDNEYEDLAVDLYTNVVTQALKGLLNPDPLKRMSPADAALQFKELQSDLENPQVQFLKDLKDQLLELDPYSWQRS